MTLSLLALWFLVLERQRLGEKKPAVTVACTFRKLLRVCGAEVDLERCWACLHTGGSDFIRRRRPSDVIMDNSRPGGCRLGRFGRVTRPAHPTPILGGRLRLALVPREAAHCLGLVPRCRDRRRLPTGV